MREALRLARLSSVFPYTRTGISTPDLDHTTPYLPPARGGPPGQTQPANLGPMIRFGHRIKTHATGWTMQQPTPGVYLWRTPHGYWYRVDNDGCGSPRIVEGLAMRRPDRGPRSPRR
jgi:hypothetical protein